jgi:hypothetical protein
MCTELIHSPEYGASSLHKPKARWTPTEDEILIRTIKAKGASNWNSIALSLTDRTGKQCRERWLSKLSPNFTADAWTAEEDEELINLQKEHGNQWALFRVRLTRRSTISIKNRWITLRRRGFGENENGGELERKPWEFEEPAVSEWDQKVVAFDGSTLEELLWEL